VKKSKVSIRFKVVRCPRCGFLQLTTASRSVKCFSCGFSWSPEPDSILFSSTDLERARSFLLKLKSGKSVKFRRVSET
jgi:ribosomal protein L37E